MGASKINILYIADPNSIHDIKWMAYTAQSDLFNVSIAVRNHHLETYDYKNTPLDKIAFIGSIPDYSLTRFPRTLITAIRLGKKIKKHKIDLIHILYAEPNALWSTFKKYFDVPIIISSRGTDVLKTIPEAFKKKSFINYLVAPLYKFAFRNADWITCTSQKQIDSINKFSGIRNHISIIRTGVNVKSLLSDTKDYFPLKNNRNFILFPRYIRPIYNHEFCLEAIKLLPAKLKREYKMVFVGKDSGDPKYQKGLENTMNSLSDVTFEFIEKQHQQGVFELYKRASLVIMTPKSDGSPVSAMEALLSGSQVVLGPLSYDKSIFSDNVFSLLMWSSDELAEKIKLALKTKRIELTSNTLKLMDRKYNMDNMLDIYSTLINGR